MTTMRTLAVALLLSVGCREDAPPPAPLLDEGEIDALAAEAVADTLNMIELGFELFTECEPVTLTVTYDSDGDTLDLQERLAAMAESRLRAARLYREGPPLGPGLVIRVRTLQANIGGGAFRFDVVLLKALRDGFGFDGRAITWSSGAFVGLYGNRGVDQSASFILQAVSEAVDRFILDYLRVNALAC